MIQLSEAVRNAMLDSVEARIGASPILRLRSGAAPANCAAADAGTVLATVQLPADWLGDAAGASKAKSGTWGDEAADAAGNAGHYRIYAADGTCHWQGSVTATGGGGDMTVDNVVLASGQRFDVTSFTLNAPGNA